MPSNLIRFAAAALLAAFAALAAPIPVNAEDAAQPPAAQPPAAPESAKPAETAPAQREAGTGEIVDLQARPFAYAEGKAERDEIFAAIAGSLKTVKAEMDKAGVKPSGRPIAVFVESGESGFRYHAGYPLETSPAGKTSLSDEVKLDQTPAGKAMRFQHQGAYADIDATYDAITAYLDEKGIDAKDDFIEEYLNDVKDVDDPALQVNIFVMMN
jgi:effector-binding domain-containing protein